jgi:GNAT superfamily N-acetyltransferase
LPLTIRSPTLDELSALSDLCLRSKAVWGYDAAFIEACRRELSFDPRELDSTAIAVAEQDGTPVGVVQVKRAGDDADLLKLFIEPIALRGGVGRTLLAWAVEAATGMGAARLTIDSDPAAAPFYRRMGARDIGEAPSASIKGRMLPRLAIELRRGDGITA